MIRKEVERLRGYLFTKEEMDDIITPILNDSRNGYIEEKPTQAEEALIKIDDCFGFQKDQAKMCHEIASILVQNRDLLRHIELKQKGYIAKE